MAPRLASGTLVSALVRRAGQQGGSAMVLAKGDVTSGAILILAYERGRDPRFFERGIGPSGLAALISSGPSALGDEAEVTAYWKRRKARDPDLWVLELDIPEAERFTAETIAVG
jgi:hypothetical protein